MDIQGILMKENEMLKEYIKLLQEELKAYKLELECYHKDENQIKHQYGEKFQQIFELIKDYVDYEDNMGD